MDLKNHLKLKIAKNELLVSLILTLPQVFSIVL